MDYAATLAFLAALAGSDPDPAAFPAVTAGGANPAYPVQLDACPRPIGRAEIEGRTIVCGTVTVPEDHAAPGGRSIDLFFTVLKARSSYPAPDPVVYLHGGPGAGTLESLEFVAEVFDPFRDTRDVVMFDQRAAGLSGDSTTCAAAFSANIVDILRGTAIKTEASPEGTVASPLIHDCVAELKASGIGLQNYNTEQNARDVSAVMGTLGYDSYNIYGISYGSKLTLEVLRTVPEGVRAVVIDGVAPPSVPLYDTLATPLSETMTILVEQCAANAACDAAYPNLGVVLNDALERASNGTALNTAGEPIPLSAVLLPFMNRNGDWVNESLTPYLPALIYEIGTDGPTPTLDRLAAQGLRLGPPNPRTPVQAARAGLTAEQRRLLDIAVTDADTLRAAEAGLDLAVDALRAVLDRSDSPLAELLDLEMSRLAGDLLADPARAAAAAEDLAAVAIGAPTAEALTGFVNRQFDGEDAARLSSLIAAMSEGEVAAAFTELSRDIGRYQARLAGDLHLWVYACQEDIPFNSPQGYADMVASLDWPVAGLAYQYLASGFFAACDLFDPAPREGFWEPVASDVPTLSIASAWDIQTAPSWAALATETLPNSRHVLIPEAGHGAIVYQPCVAEMTRAFFDDPSRPLNDSCVEDNRPNFVITR